MGSMTRQRVRSLGRGDEGRRSQVEYRTAASPQPLSRVTLVL